MIKVLVSGLINIEHSTKVDRFPIPYDPIHYGFHKNTLTISGVGYNVMMAMHTLGADVIPYGLIGQDLAGTMIKHALNARGLNQTYIHQVLKETPTSTVLVDETGKRSIYCDLKDIQDHFIPFKDDLSEVDMVILGNINFSRNLIKASKKALKLIAVDVHTLHDYDDPYNKEFLMSADIVFFSHESLNEEPEVFMKRLIKTYDINVLVCTQGEKGLLYYTKQTEMIRHLDAIKVPKMKSTVGAGDALFASFLYFFLKGHPVEQALRHATYFASYKLQFSGGSIGFLSERDLITWMKEDKDNGLY
ncbi:MAG: carbohydrate kinase family protein [Acholeplasmataceae bacterium]